MIMIAGTTQALLINLGVDLSTVDKVIFTFANHNRDIVMQKVYPGDAQISDGKLYVPLTQADTLCLTGTYNLEMQVNFVGGVVSKTATYQRTISKTLATEIVSGNAPTADTIDVIDADISDGIVIVGNGLPAGGTVGQVLTKSGTADYAAEWQDPTGGGGSDKIAHIVCVMDNGEPTECSCDMTYNYFLSAIQDNTLSGVTIKYKESSTTAETQYISDAAIGIYSSVIRIRINTVYKVVVTMEYSPDGTFSAWQD